MRGNGRSTGNSRAVALASISERCERWCWVAMVAVVVLAELGACLGMVLPR